MADKLKTLYRQLGKLGKTFAGLLLIYLVLLFVKPSSGWVSFLQFLLIILGFWLALRFTRAFMRKAIWRLRNRLLVTYLFIAVVPVLLIVTLSGLAMYLMLSQLAAYLANSELDRRIAALDRAAQQIAVAAPQHRTEVMRSVAESNSARFPQLAFVVREGDSVTIWPPGSGHTPPHPRWGNANGIVVHQGRYHLWSRIVRETTAVTAVAPISRQYLSNLVPGLGDISLLDLASGESKGGNINVTVEKRQTPLAASQEKPADVPPAVNRFDRSVIGFTIVPIVHWDDPERSDNTLLNVHTRGSAIFRTIFATKIDAFQGFVAYLLLGVSIAFLIVEIIALIIGVSLTRTITRAIHGLYEGTQRVMQGDFKHRIAVKGRDQLADLGSSFNTMTENLERLLEVAKEKERLQAEIEVARAVQEQLFPRFMPSIKTLRLAAVCEPARMVSGDFYDYQSLGVQHYSLALGDVSGKGISAALLMASIQSAMRMELRASMAESNFALNGVRLSSARIMSEMNKQMHATSAPEKFATCYFGLYDDSTGTLRYTNAGHLPPILVRNGAATRLEVNGTVMGAFPFAQYEESVVHLEPGDLLVCFTDGITEPENEYDEMFGEDRLVELVTKNAEREEEKIMAIILESVRQWTGSPELQDDMTLLLARKS
jgi:sigma-B regulation protein RsbU (phosphoserine phosphatase)